MTQLERLARKTGLKREMPNRGAFDGLLRLGRNYLVDARRPELSCQSRFQLAHGAAHAFSLAALRWHGYYTEDGRLIFRTLQDTLGVRRDEWRLLASCHERIEDSQVSGEDENLIAQVLTASDALLVKVKALPVPT